MQFIHRLVIILYGSVYTHQPININCAVFIFIYCLVLIVRRYFPHILAWQVCSWNIHMCVCVDLLVGTQTNNNIINQEFKCVFTNMFLFLNITGILTSQYYHKVCKFHVASFWLSSQKSNPTTGMYLCVTQSLERLTYTVVTGNPTRIGTHNCNTNTDV